MRICKKNPGLDKAVVKHIKPLTKSSDETALLFRKTLNTVAKQPKAIASFASGKSLKQTFSRIEGRGQASSFGRQLKANEDWFRSADTMTGLSPVWERTFQVVPAGDWTVASRSTKPAGKRIENDPAN